MKRYREVKLFDEDAVDLDEQMQEILDSRKLEKAAEENAEPIDMNADDPNDEII